MTPPEKLRRAADLLERTHTRHGMSDQEAYDTLVEITFILNAMVEGITTTVARATAQGMSPSRPLPWRPPEEQPKQEPPT